jgi:anti-sigma regulatory factor (Ser/Thr protein kinase)
MVLFDISRAITLGALAAVTAAGLLMWWHGRFTRRRVASDLMRHVSHELRTPLTGLLGTLDLLSEPDAQLELAEAAELMGLARSEATNLLQIVENVHAASRLDRDAITAKRIPVSVSQVVNEAVRRLPTVARRTYVESDPDAVAWADPSLLLQIVTNLVQNAHRYAPEGGIEVTFEHRDDRVLLHFSDDGPGVTATRSGTLFRRGESETGLGLGLPLSRSLARAMGGDLTLGTPLRSGTTFTLILPHCDEEPAAFVDHIIRPEEGLVALSPRARLLVDMVAALSERSVDRVVTALQNLYGDLLGATGGLLMMPDGSGGFRHAGSFGTVDDAGLIAHDRVLGRVIEQGCAIEITDLSGNDIEQWRQVLGGDAALFTPVFDMNEPIGVLAIGWEDAAGLPGTGGREVATALAELAGFAIHRSLLAEDIAFERSLRHSVMASLPIAISVFAGDPPKVIDWNRQEEILLGLGCNTDRPTDLGASQEKFDVQFADGTPLTLENAPVTHAIRSGQSTGPILLIIRRLDGTRVTTRTRCAPFFDATGRVAGAVVTSEELDVVGRNTFGEFGSRDGAAVGTVSSGHTDTR